MVESVGEGIEAGKQEYRKEEGEEKRKKALGKQRLDHMTMNNRGSTDVSREYLR